MNSKQRGIAFSELQSKLNRSKYIPFPTETTSTSARLFSHTARRIVPTLLLQNAFPKNVRSDAEEYLSLKDV